MADRITPYGLIMFVVGLFLENSVLMRPALVAKVAGADLWLPALLGAAPLTVIALLIVWLGELFPEETFVEYGRRVWGRWLGTMLVAVVLAFQVAKTTESAMVMRRVVALTLLPHTPDWALIGVELLAATYLAWQGIDPAVRMAEFVVIPAVLAMLTAMAMALPVAHLGYLRPVLARGWNPVFRATLTLVGHAQGIDALLLIFPWLARKRGVWKPALTIVLIRSTTYFVLLVVPVLVLGVPDTIREVLPVLAVVRNLELRGTGLERIDSLFTGVWLLAGYLPLSFRLYLSASGLAHLFGKTDHRPFLWPILAVVTVGAALPVNVVTFARLHQVLGYFGLAAFVGVVPLLAAGALVWRWRRGALRSRT